MSTLDDQRLDELTALAEAPASTDPLFVLDESDTTRTAQGSPKQMDAGYIMPKVLFYVGAYPNTNIAIAASEGLVPADLSAETGYVTEVDAGVTVTPADADTTVDMVITKPCILDLYVAAQTNGDSSGTMTAGASFADVVNSTILDDQEQTVTVAGGKETFALHARCVLTAAKIALLDTGQLRAAFHLFNGDVGAHNLYYFEASLVQTPLPTDT